MSAIAASKGASWLLESQDPSSVLIPSGYPTNTG